MKNKVLFSTFLVIISFVFINSYNAKDNFCHFEKYYNDVSTLNFTNKFKEDFINKIKKICTNNICTYNLSNDYKRMIDNHKDSVINHVIDEDKKMIMNLKGIKIDTIYFRDCI